MAFNINDFKTKGLTLGGVRPTLFQVIVNLPTPLAGVSSNFQEKFAFTCSATSIPASAVSPIEVSYFGRQIKLAGDRTFDNWAVSVMNDEDFIVRNAFEAWSNALNTHVGNRRIISANETTPGASYKADAIVTQFAKGGINGGAGSNSSNGADSVIRQYSFVGLFPISVSAMSVDWNATNRIQTFEVQFAYDYWLPLVTNNNGAIDTGASGGSAAAITVY
jgi:hypothetical protein